MCKIFNTENYKILLRKTKDLNKCKAISYLWKDAISLGSQVSPNLLLQHNQKPSWGFPGGAVVENLPANAGDTSSSPGLGRSHMLRSN